MKNGRGRGEIGEEWGKKEGEGNRREGRGHPVILAFVHPDMKYNTELMTFCDCELLALYTCILLFCDCL